MHTLATLLTGTALPRMPGAAPIAFQLDGATWRLDPHAGDVVAEGAPERPALTKRCSADVLLRLLTDTNFGLRAGEALELSGDLGPLYAVVDALNGPPSVLQARIASVASLRTALRPADERSR